jgi:hypothetical protein
MMKKIRAKKLFRITSKSSRDKLRTLTIYLSRVKMILITTMKEFLELLKKFKRRSLRETMLDDICSSYSKRNS